MSLTKEKKERLRELRAFFEEYDKDMPEWFKKQRVLARKIHEEYEEKGTPESRYGMDFDLTYFRPDAGSEHPQLKNLPDLDETSKRTIETVGQRPDEKYRTGTKLQEDASTTYLAFTELAQKEFMPKYPEGLVIMEIEEAIRKFPWLENYAHHIVPINLDPYTAYCAGYSAGGVFVWVKEGVVVDWPIQACFLIETAKFAQLPYIVVIAEPHSKVHLISGCVIHPKCDNALHGCITEIYVGEGAEVTYTMTHNFKPAVHVRPKIGAVVEENGTYLENLIILGPAKSEQAYPTAVLRGKNSRASIRTLALGVEKTDIDIGSAILFTGEGSRGELMTRAVATERSTIRMRGTLKAYNPNVRGHLECRGLLLSELAQAYAYPNLRSLSPEANLTHEAAVGKIAEEQLYYLMSRGLSEDDAVSMITRGFLDTEIPGMPAYLQSEIRKIVDTTVKKVM